MTFACQKLLGQTPSQTLGPFFHQGLVRVSSMFQVPGLCADAVDVIGNVLAGPSTPGERVRIEGVVYDGVSKPVPDALIEIWQADAQGRYHTGGASSFDSHVEPSAVWGFGRAPTDAAGTFFFETVKPGSAIVAPGPQHAAHVNVIVGARGMARHAFTRIYFAGDPDLESDPVLARVPRERWPTLIAQRGVAPIEERRGAPSSQRGGAPIEERGGAPGVVTYHFDIRLQGDRETVFFDF